MNFKDICGEVFDLRTNAFLTRGDEASKNVSLGTFVMNKDGDDFSLFTPSFGMYYPIKGFLVNPGVFYIFISSGGYIVEPEKSRGVFSK